MQRVTPYDLSSVQISKVLDHGYFFDALAPQSGVSSSLDYLRGQLLLIHQKMKDGSLPIGNFWLSSADVTEVWDALNSIPSNLNLIKLEFKAEGTIGLVKEMLAQGESFAEALLRNSPELLFCWDGIIGVHSSLFTQRIQNLAEIKMLHDYEGNQFVLKFYLNEQFSMQKNAEWLGYACFVCGFFNRIKKISEVVKNLLPARNPIVDALGIADTREPLTIPQIQELTLFAIFAQKFATVYAMCVSTDEPGSQPDQIFHSIMEVLLYGVNPHILSSAAGLRSYKAPELAELLFKWRNNPLYMVTTRAQAVTTLGEAGGLIWDILEADGPYLFGRDGFNSEALEAKLANYYPEVRNEKLLQMRSAQITAGKINWYNLFYDGQGNPSLPVLNRSVWKEMDGSHAEAVQWAVQGVLKTGAIMIHLGMVSTHEEPFLSAIEAVLFSR